MTTIGAIVLLVWCVDLSEAQGVKTTTIEGQVFDPSGASLPNASITVEGPSLIGGTRSTTSKQDGSYRIYGLSSGRLALRAAAPGFSRLDREVVAQVGSTLVVDFHLLVQPVDVRVDVRGGSGLVDLRSAAAPAHIDSAMLQELPLVRSVAEIINLAPGVASNVGFGATQSTNAIYLDGVDITESQEQRVWNEVNFNWVAEMSVHALGASAEYGEFTGVAANAVLRSGSNRFSGLAEYRTTRPNWLASNTSELSDQLQRSFEPRRILRSFDTTAQVGGPIRQDRIWFFGGVEHVHLEDQPAGYSGPGSAKLSDWRLIGKMTAALSSGARLEGLLQRTRRATDGEEIGPFRPLETTYLTRQPQTMWNSEVTWVLGNTTLVEGRHGGFVTDWKFDPRPPSSRSGPSPRYDMLTNMASGNVPDYFEADRVQHTTAASLTKYLDRVLGRHEFKAGLEVEWVHAVNQDHFPTGRQYDDEGGVPSVVYLWDGDVTDVTSTRTALYVRDRAVIGERITIEPGLRIDLNRGSVRTRGKVFGTSPISPRLGVAWNLSRKRDTVVRAHFGRYHDALFSNRIRFMDFDGMTPTIYAQVVGPDEFVEIERYTPVDNFRIDPSIRHSYVDQYVVGAEHQLGQQVTIQGQYIHRRFEKFMGLIDTGTVWELVQRLDPGPDGVIGSADDGGPLTVSRKTNPGNEFYVYTNPPDAFRHYHALQAIARKRYSQGWQLQASYTWSHSDGTVGNAPATNTGLWDLGSPGVFVNPNLRRNARGAAPLDFTHEVKAFGSYRIPVWGGWNVSSVYRYQSGVAWGRVAIMQALAPNPRVRLEPRGTRRLPALNNVDMRLEKTFRPARVTGSVGVYADVFNLGNQAVPNSNYSWAVVEVSGPSFGEPGAWLDPRRLQVGVRYVF